jgi:hypothetical protein
MSRFSILIVLLTTLLAAAAGAQTDRIHPAPGLGDYDLPFFPDGSYRSGVKSPDDFLGYRLGSTPTTHEMIFAYLDYLAETFPNATIHDYGETYEGRRLGYLVVTSEKNAEKLADYREDLAKLADPRGLDDGKAARIIKDTPAVAWMAYGIHGDELSSSEGALQLAYQLLAGTDTQSRLIMDELIVCIDPCENPDGRTRWLQQLTQFGSAVPSHDIQSMVHRGQWPWGRMNHYLFDLNRDWFAGVHPETRGKTAAILDWMPQYLLDCHEMGPTDTYMFSPPREPFNPHMVNYIHKWWYRAARDLGSSFDRYGWSYYTREWNEEFYPGYGSSWAIYLGGVGMLFEQAGVDGSQVKRYEGTVMTFRETVHHQFLGSFSNLLTMANGREELLSDYYNVKLANVKPEKNNTGAFLFPPGPNVSRLARFAGQLLHQHIEVETASASFKPGSVVSGFGEDVRNKTFPAGTLIVRTSQPLKQLVEVILSFDIRIPDAYLEIERKEILKRNRSKMYEVSGWSMPLAYGLDAYYAETLPRLQTEPYNEPESKNGLFGDDSPVGFVFDCTDDRSYHLLIRLLDKGYKIWSSRKPFENDGKLFPRGSFQIRLNANPQLDPEEIGRLAEDTGVEMFGINTSLGAKYADLGGGEFRLLERPRIALVGGYPASAYTFGTCWHLLDSQFGVRTTLLDVTSLPNADLDKYNVLVLPDVWGDAMTYNRVLGNAGVKKLKTWVDAGGTLIAMGNSAAFLADSSVAMSSVRPRRQVLKNLARYDEALATAEEAESIVIDSLLFWEGRPGGENETAANDKKNTPFDQIKAADERAQKLYPRGAILRVDLDDEHWLTVGCPRKLPVMFNSDYAYMAAGGVQIAGRLAGGNDIRLSGMMWPEAKERWQKTAWLTREGKGKGQIILFASPPNFRGYFHGAERLLLNAMFLGPGFGARQSIEW